MSIEETDAEDAEPQPADTNCRGDREGEGAARPGAAVPLTDGASQFADTDFDEQDDLEIDYDDYALDEPQFIPFTQPPAWLLRLVELLLATAILFLFL